MGSGAEKKAGSGEKATLKFAISQVRSGALLQSSVRRDISLGRIIRQGILLITVFESSFWTTILSDQQADIAESASPRFQAKCAKPIPSKILRSLEGRL